jgi:hypothetical protein
MPFAPPVPAARPRPATVPDPQSAGAPSPRAALPPPVNLRIDRLILHGFPFAPRDGARVERAFQAEVGRVLASGQLQAEALSGHALERLRLDPLTLPQNAQPEQLGRALAAALLRGLAP